MKRIILKYTWVLCLFFLQLHASAISPVVYYNTGPWSDSIMSNTINQPGAFTDVAADYFPAVEPAANNITWHPNYQMRKSDGAVVLKVNRFTNECLPASFTSEVTVRISYYKWDPVLDAAATNNQKVVLNDIKLKVNYNKNQGITFKEKDIYSLEWAHYIKVEVISVSDPKLSRFLVLETDIQQERYAHVTDMTVRPTIPSVLPPLLNSSNQITLRFNPAPTTNFATEYDIEWTFVEAYDHQLNNIIDYAYLENNFPDDLSMRFNATRVTVDKSTSSYTFSNIFERGYLIYRVRAVGQHLDTDGTLKRVECDWSDAAHVAISASGFAEHLPGMNWQYSCAFAEEGKKKESITYFDGSLRSRQTVAQSINSLTGSMHVVVQDKIYDFQGRPAIEVLPSPMASAELTYYPLTSTSGGGEYSKELFDKRAQTNAPVMLAAVPMNTSSGAANYYSASSQWLSSTETNFANYVPVAGGFPFVQTIYTNDNTGRVERKSGAGADHAIGSGHETVYEYLRPNQDELDRLFGSEVGYSEHYQKNVVKDPNGQLSVSYLNASGKVIATGLAGPQPGNVTQLTGYKSGEYNQEDYLEVNLMTESERINLENGILHTHSFYVTQQTNYKFKYTLNVSGFDLASCQTPAFCADCVYDLEISITDKRNQEQLNYQTANTLLKTTIGGVDDGSGYRACETPSAAKYQMSNSFDADGNGFITLTLEPGLYTISKKLTTNAASLEYYANKYVEEQQCKTLEEFKTEAEAAIDFSGCGLTCEGCYTQNGVASPFGQSEIDAARAAYITSQTNIYSNMGKAVGTDMLENFGKTFDIAIKQCSLICNPNPDKCDAIKQILLSDLTPGGQYAKFKEVETTSGSGIYVNAADDVSSGNVFDEYNVLSEETLSVFSFKEVPAFQDLDIVLPSGQPAKVANLTENEFITNFKPEWAEMMLYLHPEFCKYERCSLEKASADFSTRMGAVLTYDEAKVTLPGTTGSYLRPILADPFFGLGCVEAVYADNMLTSRLTNVYKSVPQYWTYVGTNKDVQVIAEVSGSNLVLRDVFSTLTPKKVVGYILNTTTPAPHQLVYPTPSATTPTGKLTIDPNGSGTLMRIAFINPDYTVKMTKYTIYDLPIMQLYCSDLGINESKKMSDCVKKGRQKLVTECKEVKDRYWVIFKSLYLSNKTYLELFSQESENAQGACVCNPVIVHSEVADPLIKRSRRIYPSAIEGGSGLFHNGSTLQDPMTFNPTPAEINGITATTSVAIEAACTQQCESYADYWMSKLAPCLIEPESLRTEIKDEFVKICKFGCDVNNPLGSITVPPIFDIGGARSSEAAYKNFEAVLLAKLGANYRTITCDVNMIKVPKPYGHDYLSTESPYADTCSCNETEYNYFVNRGIKCSFNIASSGENCPCKNSTGISENKKNELMIGKDAEAGYKCKKCIGCLELNEAYDAFIIRYPTLNQSDKQFAPLLENFMNNTLNLNQTYKEYLALAANCINLPVTATTFNDFHTEYISLDLAVAEPAYHPPHLWEMNSSPVMIAVEQKPVLHQPVLIQEENTHAPIWSNRFFMYNNPTAMLPETGDENNTQAAGLAYLKANTAKMKQALQASAQTTAGPDEPEPDPNATVNYTPVTAGVDKCGCDKILNIMKDNPTFTDEQLSTAFANQYNFGNKLDNFADLKKLCCKSYNGIVEKGDNDNEVNPDGAGDDQPGGGFPEDDQPDPSPEPTPEVPCTLSVAPGATLEWSAAALQALADNAKYNPQFKFPGNLRCQDNHAKQADMCACDILTQLHADFVANGVTGSFAAYVKQQRNLPNEIPDLQRLLDICTQIKALTNGTWTDDSRAILNDYTSNPLLTVHYTMLCDPLPPPGGTPGSSVNDGSGWIGPKPCTIIKDLSCSQFASLVSGIYGGNGSNITQAQLDIYKANTANWQALIAGFKSLLLGGVADGCVVNVRFRQDADLCGENRRRFYPFSMQNGVTDNFVTNMISRVALFGCGCVEAPSWLTMTPWPAEECTTCYGPTKSLVQLEKYLNELASATSATQVINQVSQVFNSFHTTGLIPTNSAYRNIYNGGNPTGLKHQWVAAAPFVDAFYRMKITDEASSNLYTKYFTFSFRNRHPSFRIYFVRKFSNIRPACPDPEHNFLVDVEYDVYDPYAPGGTPPVRLKTTIQGTVDASISNDIILGKEFNCCAKLCNIPAMREIASTPCEDHLRSIAVQNATHQYNEYITGLKDEFKRKYMLHCFGSQLDETFVMKYTPGEYHLTLYYYDQAGNLTQTVPPEGVDPITSRATLDLVKLERNGFNLQSPANLVHLPPHTMQTYYQYNTLNQLVWQKTPDAGISTFYYDALGRIIFSRNYKQAHSTGGNEYSYTRYDLLGRIMEVGQVLTPHTLDHTNSRNTAFVNTVLAGNKTEITKTLYDISAPGGYLAQQNLKNRVSMVSYQHFNGSTVDHAAYYSYDIHGNVKQLGRLINSLQTANMDEGFKLVDYDYDLISGKVNSVVYQAGAPDQFIHRYSYDMDNRLTEVVSGKRVETLERDATYFYYLHGPLARVELGAQLVQGIDYTYTIQGWLKGVNSATLQPGRDIGRDGYFPAQGQPVNLHQHIPKDAFGFTLDYFNNDYTPANAATNNGTPVYNQFMIGRNATPVIDGNLHPLYNGNIMMMTTAIAQFMEGGAAPLASVYRYDQLNRIITARYYNNVDMSANNWQNTGAMLDDYFNVFSYDANGNIKTQVRNGSTASGLAMDNLTYNYIAGTNQLRNVADVVLTDNYTDDISNQTSTDNYEYDKIGNMTKDVSEEIAEIKWTVYGKIKSITRISGSLKPDLEFEYTPDGHRAVKIVKPKGPGMFNIYTYYVRDAQGNIMATYERKFERIIDYQSLTFSDVNAKLLEYSGPTGFASFITSLHGVQGTNAGLANYLENNLVTNPPMAEECIQNTYPQTLLNSDANLFNAVLRNYNPANYHQAIASQIFGDDGKAYMESICACIDDNLLLKTILKNESIRNEFFRILYDNYPSSYDKVLSAATGTVIGYEDDMVNLTALLNDVEYAKYESTMDALLAELEAEGYHTCNQPLLDLWEIWYADGDRQQLWNLIELLPEMGLHARIAAVCQCTETELLEWFSDNNVNQRVHFFKALFYTNPTVFDAVLTDLTYTSTGSVDLNAALTFVQGVANNNDIVSACQNNGLYACSPLFKEILMNMAAFAPADFEAVIAELDQSTNDWTVHLTNKGCLAQVYNCPGEEVYTRSQIADALTYQDKTYLWNTVISIEGIPAIISYLKNNMHPEFIYAATIAGPGFISAYQQQQPLYAGAADNMKTYFAHIKQYFGQTAYDNLAAWFYNNSTSYSDSLNVTEYHIYGSARLGTNKKPLNIYYATYTSANGGSTQQGISTIIDAEDLPVQDELVKGLKQYELSNHLGNVLAVVSDKVLPGCTQVNAEDFSTNLGGFTPYWATPLTVDNGRMKITNIGGGSGGANLNLNTEMGKTYVVRFDADMGQVGEMVARIVEYNPNFSITSQLYVNSNGHHEFYFTATRTGSRLTLFTPTNLGYFWVDNVVVDEITDGANQGVLRADLLQASDYSPFGAPLANRSWNIKEELNKVQIASHTFAANTEGWAGTGSSTVQATGGRLQFSSSSTNVSVGKTYTTGTGKRYRLSADIDPNALTTGVELEITGYNNAVLLNAPISSVGHRQIDFVSNSTSITVKLKLTGTAAGTRVVYLDNVKLEEIKGDMSGSRFGFNGQEKDDEVVGEGNLYTAEFWEYDPRTSVRWNVDPETKNFPWQSPYVTFSRNPILRVDPLGNSDDEYVNEKGEKLGTDKDGANGVTRVVSNQEWNTATSQNGGATTEAGTKALRDLSAKNPILFSNENTAYNYIWNNSFSNGKFNVENAAWLTDKGVVALPTTGNTSNGASLTGAKEVGTSGKYTFNFAGSNLNIKGSIHTHPPGGVKTDEWDIDASKYGPSFVMNSDKIWVNYYHGGYKNPKGLAVSPIMNTNTLLKNPNYSLINYANKAYWNVYFKKP